MGPAATEPVPHAVIVGAGPGLGASLARVFAEAGFDLTLIARRAASTGPAAEWAQAHGRTARRDLVDAGDLDAVRGAVGRANDWRPISLLHHNASMHVGGLLDADADTLRTSVSVNVLAAVVAVQTALPGLLATGGEVTWTGGGVALKPNPDYGVLSVGKAALRAAAFALAPELARHGIELRMLTVAGIIRPGGPFDPDLIAEAFWAFARERDAGIERIYDGRSR